MACTAGSGSTVGSAAVSQANAAAAVAILNFMIAELLMNVVRRIVWCEIALHYYIAENEVVLQELNWQVRR